MIPGTDLTLYILSAVIAILIIWIVRLEMRLKRLLAGKRASSLENVMHGLVDRIRRTDEVNAAIKEHLVNMEGRVRRSVQHVKTIRFNPFPDQGGNQSSVTAFLDEDGNGAVISTLYARDKVSVYAKPIAGYASEHELSGEEQAALNK